MAVIDARVVTMREFAKYIRVYKNNERVARFVMVDTEKKIGKIFVTRSDSGYPLYADECFDHLAIAPEAPQAWLARAESLGIPADTEEEKPVAEPTVSEEQNNRYKPHYTEKFNRQLGQ